MKKVIIASKNKHKLEEIKELFKSLPLEIKSMDEVGLDQLEIIEDGETFEENSMKKAVEVMKITNGIAIADDSGLEVLAIDNRPGVYSARFSGEDATDKKNNEKLLEMLKDVPMEDRKARFVCVMSVAFPDGKKLSVRGECEGVIGFEEKGEHGFGYDPLFIIPKYNKTFAELGADIKNKMSHRANALEELKVKLASAL